MSEAVPQPRLQPPRRRRDHLRLALIAVTAAVLSGGLVIRLLPGPEAPLVEEGKLPPSAAKLAEPSVLPPADPAFDRHFKAGVAAMLDGRADDALAMFELARARQPHAPELLVNIGFVHLALKELDAAEAAFNQATEVRPGQANAYYGLALVLDQRGDVGGALGMMNTYMHLTDIEDPFRIKAEAAVWELRARLAAERGGMVPAHPPLEREEPGEGGAPAASAGDSAGEQAK